MTGFGRLRLAALAAASLAASPSWAQDRSTDNAVTQAEDGFGFSIGRESLGIYSAGNVRGFSPTAAGNVRIDGLYFDPAASLTSAISSASSIKVGLSAQGYPFAAPSGIVDYRLNRPGPSAGTSLIANADGFGSFGIEADGSVPLGPTLALGYGLAGSHTEFVDGTSNWLHSESLIARWRPRPSIEIVSFWSLSNDYDDEAGTFFLPAGRFLPPVPKQRRFDGPDWADIRFTAANYGAAASAVPAKDWLVRIGAFRSINDVKSGYSNLLADEQPDGSAERILVADPHRKNVSLSGEFRVTHSMVDGPRLHVVHLSLRERDARRAFGGSDEIDFGPGRVGEPFHPPRPVFSFGPLSHDRVRQQTYGLAYDGRWRNVGEIGISLARADYRKTTALAGAAPVISRSRPWLYDVTAAANLSKRLVVYAGYARGLEESGVAPANAANRNQPLPAVLTQQKDAGLRLNLTPKLRAVAGLFDLERPYFGFDAANRYLQVGTTRSRGAEFSLSGSLTPRLDMVAGGVFLRPRVAADAGATGQIGRRPAGLPTHLLNVNFNWRAPRLSGLELDAALSLRGATPATTDDQVVIPPRNVVSLGSHYRFRLARRNAAFRLQMVNLFDTQGLGYNGPGVYAFAGGRSVAGYLTIDI